MLLAALIVLTSPAPPPLTCLVFDTKHNAADTFFDTIVAIVKAICVPRIVRVLAGDDEDDAWGLLPIAAFFLACGALVYGEHYLITKYLLAGG